MNGFCRRMSSKRLLGGLLVVALCLTMGDNATAKRQYRPVRVRVELVNVYCWDTEDVTGADDFYVVGAFTDGARKKGVLTRPIEINDNQRKAFAGADRVVFDGHVMPYQVVVGGLKALDEDFAKDWRKQSQFISYIVHAISVSGAALGHPEAAAIAETAYTVFDRCASADKDDLLGKQTFVIPGNGPSVEKRTWLIRGGKSSYSNWQYAVELRITRM